MYSLSLSGIPIEFSLKNIFELPENVDAIFVLLNRSRQGTEYIYWGSGNLRSELRRLYLDAKVSRHHPEFFNYVEPVGNPQTLLNRLKQQFPPLIP